MDIHGSLSCFMIMRDGNPVVEVWSKTPERKAFDHRITFCFA